MSSGIPAAKTKPKSIRLGLNPPMIQIPAPQDHILNCGHMPDGLCHLCHLCHDIPLTVRMARCGYNSASNCLSAWNTQLPPEAPREQVPQAGATPCTATRRCTPLQLTVLTLDINKISGLNIIFVISLRRCLAGISVAKIVQHCWHVIPLVLTLNLAWQFGSSRSADLSTKHPSSLKRFRKDHTFTSPRLRWKTTRSWNESSHQIPAGCTKNCTCSTVPHK